MSDHYLAFIPEDPVFVPGKASQAAALALVRQAWPHIEEVEVITDEHVVFRDCGENFESIRCPHCDTEIEVEHWQELMDRDYMDEGGFRLDALPMSCCGKKSTLNALSYRWPMGFSRFVLRTADPGCAVPEPLRIELESAMGCRLRLIHQMY